VRYAIAPEDHIRIDREARQRGLEILGYFHSHPDHPARPSETDRQRAADTLSDGVIHVVVGVEKGEQATPTAWVFRDATQSFEAEALEAKHKGLKDRLCDPAGELRAYVRVFVDEEDVRFLDGKKSALKAGDTVAIVPAIAGGGC